MSYWISDEAILQFQMKLFSRHGPVSVIFFVTLVSKGLNRCYQYNEKVNNFREKFTDGTINLPIQILKYVQDLF